MPLLCWPPGPGYPQASRPSQENAATVPHVAQVTPTVEEKVTFPSAQAAEGGSVGKKSLTQGQVSKVKAAIETFPLAAEFWLQERCWFGVMPIKMPSSFLARRLPRL
ncbi:hypothetical protein J1605_001465 [Eschrichtius robustus]|uniref:Uncharacterized protein n=1 Tax=Eschrichtius robustus TaxID=9764 RepID=A0AB34I4C0_ESCRO|nr:hypothetical protein J1605_001465 [Eschrichtius robustus]